MPSVPRDQAGSLVLPPKKSRATAQENANTEVLECGGNTQLMEARLCQMTCSLRALTRSNQELEDALKESPDDVDFLQAIAENKLTIRRQGQVALALVQELQTRGCNVELEDDIRSIVAQDVTVVMLGSASTEVGDGNSNNPNSTGNGETGDRGGLYL